MHRTFATIAFVLGSSAAYAIPVTFGYKGYVLHANGQFSSVAVNSQISGTFTLDDELRDSAPNDPALDLFGGYTPENQALLSTFSATVSFDNFSTTVAASDPSLSGAGFNLIDGNCLPQGDCDVAQVSITTPEALFRLYAVDLAFPFSGAYTDGVAEGPYNLTNDIAGAMSLLEHLDLSLFNDWQMSYSSYTDRATSDRVIFRWTEVFRAPVSVPEPGALLLLGAGLVPILIRRRKSAATV